MASRCRPPNVQADLNDLANCTAAILKKADELYSKDCLVCLRIGAAVLEGEERTLSQHNHCVALASRVTTDFAVPTSKVSMNVFTRGTIRRLPALDMTLDDFIDYYYGYVAAKY